MNATDKSFDRLYFPDINRTVCVDAMAIANKVPNEIMETSAAERVRNEVGSIVAGLVAICSNPGCDSLGDASC